MKPLSLVLASSSPARKALLNRLGLSFICHAPDVDETPLPGENTADLVLRLSLAKAKAVASHYPEALIIGADLIGVCDNHWLGKPGDRENAIQHLIRMSGKVCEFWCGLAVLNTATQEEYTYREKVVVEMRELSRERIEAYLDKEPEACHCAGSFHIETLGITLVKAVHSQDPTTLIGLPLIQLTEQLSLWNRHPAA